MWTFFSILLVACVTVEGTPGEAGDDTGPAPGGADPWGDPPGDDPAGDGSLEGCAGTYDGSYSGAESGSFEATVDPAAMEVRIADVDGSGGLEGVGTLEADGAVHVESQGYWMDGVLDLATCRMSGEWGVVGIAMPGGTWETTP